MFQLIYVSGATRVGESDDIHSILETSRNNNRNLGVTGLLIYSDGTFIQVLENERDVFEMFRKAIEESMTDAESGILLDATMASSAESKSRAA